MKGLLVLPVCLVLVSSVSDAYRKIVIPKNESVRLCKFIGNQSIQKQKMIMEIDSANVSFLFKKSGKNASKEFQKIQFVSLFGRYHISAIKNGWFTLENQSDLDSYEERMKTYKDGNYSSLPLVKKMRLFFNTQNIILVGTSNYEGGDLFDDTLKIKL